MYTCRLLDMEILVVRFCAADFVGVCFLHGTLWIYSMHLITFSCLVRPVDNPCFRGGGYVMIATAVSIWWRHSSFLASLLLYVENGCHKASTMRLNLVYEDFCLVFVSSSFIF